METIVGLKEARLKRDLETFLVEWKHTAAIVVPLRATP